MRFLRVIKEDLEHLLNAAFIGSLSKPKSIRGVELTKEDFHMLDILGNDYIVQIRGEGGRNCESLKSVRNILEKD